MTPHILKYLCIILSLSVVGVSIHAILRQLRSRIDIFKYARGTIAQSGTDTDGKKKKKKRKDVEKPLYKMAYVKHNVQGKSAEAFLPDGSQQTVGRIAIDKSGEKAIVQLLASSLEDESGNPVYRRVGYVDETGIIYRQTVKNGAAKAIGYVARPSKPTEPCTKGERSWKKLWLHAILDVYRYTEEEAPVEIPEEIPVEENPVPVEENPVEEIPMKVLSEVIPEANLVAIPNILESAIPAIPAVPAVPESDTSAPAEPVATEPAPEEPAATEPAPQKPRAAERVARCDLQGFAQPKIGAITSESRAGAYALFASLENPNQYDEYFGETRYGWKDTALLSTIVYALCFMTYYVINTSILQRPLVGRLRYGVYVIYAFFYVVWALVRSVKIERIEGGNSFQPQLDLLNKTLGQRWIENAILFLTTAAMPLSISFFDYDFIPLLMAIDTGFGINKAVKGVSAPWRVKKSYSDRATDEPEMDEDGELETNQAPEGDMSNSYDWDLDYDGISLHGNLSIRFDPDMMKGERQNNPFFYQATYHSTTIVKKLFELLCHRRDYMERVRYLARYIQMTAEREDLAEQVKLQFALDFIQEPNIRLVQDKDSEPIQYALMYMRFPDELLFDKQGDYDCKAFFAALLFYAMGYDVLFLYSNKHDHYAVGVEERYNWTDTIWTDGQNRLKKQYQDKSFVLCETSADHFRIGDMLEGIIVDDFDFVEYFQQSDFTNSNE